MAKEELKEKIIKASINLYKKAASVNLKDASTNAGAKILRGKRSSLKRRASKLEKMVRDGNLVLPDVSGAVKKYENQLLFGVRKKTVTKDKNGQKLTRARFVVPSELK